MKVVTKEKKVKTIKRSVKVWNRYRRVSPDIIHDLSDSDLAEESLLWVNLSKADLSKSKFFRSNLTGANLSGANLSGASFYETNLYGANLSESNCTGADLSEADTPNANFSNTDLSGADLDFTQLELSCRTLTAKFDQKHIVQILYHAGMPCQNNNIELDKDVEILLNSKAFKKVVNKFHKLEEGGEYTGIKTLGRKK